MGVAGWQGKWRKSHGEKTNWSNDFLWFLGAIPATLYFLNLFNGIERCTFLAPKMPCHIFLVESFKSVRFWFCQDTFIRVRRLKICKVWIIQRRKHSSGFGNNLYLFPAVPFLAANPAFPKSSPNAPNFVVFGETRLFTPLCQLPYAFQKKGIVGSFISSQSRPSICSRLAHPKARPSHRRD
jgi:hypothetical protein